MADVPSLCMDLPRRGPTPLSDLTVDNLMQRFDFTFEDLEANRRGTISPNQRNRLLHGRRRVPLVLVAGWMFVTAFVVLAINLNTGIVVGLVAGLVAAALVGAVFIGPWWYQNRYPLGDDRVKLLIAPTSQAQNLAKGRQTRVGKGLGGRWLPRPLPNGTMVRLYWNAGPGGETIVHSIEPAQPGDTTNITKRNFVGRVLVGLLAVGLVVFGVALLLQEQQNQRELEERIENLDLEPDLDFDSGLPDDFDPLIPLPEEPDRNSANESQ